MEKRDFVAEVEDLIVRGMPEDEVDEWLDSLSPEEKQVVWNYAHEKLSLALEAMDSIL